MRKFTKSRFAISTFIFLFIFIKFIVAPDISQCDVTPKIATGWDHSFVIKADGTLWAWGQNTAGQLGDGTTIDRFSPVPVGTDNNWIFASGGYGWSLALKSDGTLWAWGRNGSGQLGDGTTIRRFMPVQIGTDNSWVLVKAGNNHNLALKADRTLWAWGVNNNRQLGFNTTETCTTPHDVPCSTIPVQIGTDANWISIFAGGYHSVALKSNGTVWTWGNNYAGELGYASSEMCTHPLGFQFPCTSSPTQVGTATDWISIASGEYHTLALKSNGTIWAWGDNYYGQLGFDTTENCSGPDTPCSTTPQQVGTDTDWVMVTAGGFQTFAIKSNGTLWEWGRVGVWPNPYIHSPTVVGNDSDWLTVSEGGNHTLALKTDGTLWTWGGNDFGELGFTTTETCSNPYVTWYCAKSPVLLLHAGTCPYQSFRITAGSPLYYNALQSAYDVAANGSTIQGSALSSVENLSFSRNISVTLQGGYDCDYISASGKTTINGSVLISDGNVTLEHFILQ